MHKKIRIKKQNSKKKSNLFWICAAILSMTVYIGWRIFFTLPDHETYGWLAAICGILLVVSEAISMLEGTEHFFRLGKKTQPDMPVVPYDRYPHVDVLIATHNEDADLLYKTVNGCLHMDYPDKSKVHIYLCDDGARPEIEQLAAQMGVGYCGLRENKDAKAGNLNNALSKTSSPWVVTFDADMIPTHDFLMETVPYIFLPQMKQLEDGSWVDRTEEEIDPKYKIGFIQTPQSFYNPDLFQYNFYSEKRIPNEQDYFFREVNVGRNSSNAPIYAGSNTLISRQALEEVGGIATGTITEDFETGLAIQSKGYSCYAVDKTLAHGLAPTEVDSLIRQRVRWGRGCISSLRRVHLLLNPKFSLGVKISYMACWMYWWTFFRRFIYIISPILFVLFNIPVVICSLWELLLIWLPSYVLYNYTLSVTSSKIRNKRWSNTIDTVIFPYMILPILKETLFIRQTKFNVTNKTRTVQQSNDLMLALPQILLLGLDLLALFVSVIGALNTRNFGAIIIIYWLAVNAMHLLMAVFFMAGRKNLRVNDRFSIKIPVEIQYRGRTCYGVTEDASETGLSVRLDSGLYLPRDPDDPMTLRLRTDRWETTLKAYCVHVKQTSDSWKYGIQILEMEPKEKGEYFQILYDRDHSLAHTVHRASGLFDDLFLNVQKRSVPKTRSQRALPRVQLDLPVQTAEGAQVYMRDTNYEYVKLEGVFLPEKLELMIPDGHRMQCVRVPQREGLYQVTNWQQLLFDDAYEHLFAALPQTALAAAKG